MSRGTVAQGQRVKVRLELTDGYRERFTEAVCRRVVAARKRERIAGMERKDNEAGKQGSK